MEEIFEEIEEHLSLKDKVYSKLKLQIISGKLPPGMRLRESKLSEIMKISRAPIREALNRLEKEGIVTIIPRRGAMVSSITKEEVESIWEIRSLLEPYAARNAALKCEEKELTAIENKLKKLSEEPYDFSGYMSSDLELHELLYKHLNNIMLKEIIEMVRLNSLRVLNFAEGQSAFSKEIAFSDINEHLQIIEALKTRDPERAEASVYIHIMNSKQRIMQALEQKGDI